MVPEWFVVVWAIGCLIAVLAVMTYPWPCLFHKWIAVYTDETQPQVVQQCKRCKRYRSTMYDMTYGTIHWVSGNLWAKVKD